jgi:hypothetical protein
MSKRVLRYWFGYGVPQPPCIPPGATRWRWSVSDQAWTPTGQPNAGQP